MESLRRGKTIVFGHYYQDSFRYKDPIRWYVVNIEKNKATLVSEKLLRCLPFSDYDVECTWATSKIREFLNHQMYYEMFDKKERSVVLLESIKTESLDKNGESQEERTDDKVYLMSEDEFRRYWECIDYGFLTQVSYLESPFFQNNDHLNLENYSYWWLRSLGKTKNTKRLGPHITKAENSTIEGIRPTICIDIDRYMHFDSIAVEEKEDRIETEIPEGVFTGTDIVHYEVPETVNIICDYAFAGCQELKTVVIRNPRCIIQPKAFAGCADIKIHFEIGEEGKYESKISDAISRIKITPQEIWLDNNKVAFIINRVIIFTDIEIEEEDCRVIDNVLVNTFGMGRIKGKLAYLDKADRYESYDLSIY